MKKLSVVLGLALLTSSAHAQVSQTSADARRVFNEMRAKYAALETYSHRTKHQEHNGKIQPRQAEFSFRQPNRYAMRIKRPEGDLIAVSTGHKLYIYSQQFSKTKYGVLPLPSENLGRIGLMQYPDRVGSSFIAPLLAGVDPFTAPWGDPAVSFNLGKPTKINGVMTDVVVVRVDDKWNSTRTYFIGQKDHLLHRIVQTGKQNGKTVSMLEEYQDVRANPKISIETFAFISPLGTRQYLPMEYEYEKKLIAPEVKPGAPAPALSGAGLDGKTIYLADYRGKVVLLYFWATWCGPCIVEAPYARAAYDKFHGQGFEIIGISFDSELAELEKYVRKQKVAWPQIFDGKTWESEANKNYKVRAIPTLILIGRDGKIAEFNPRRLLLEPAIEKALSTPAPE